MKQRTVLAASVAAAAAALAFALAREAGAQTTTTTILPDAVVIHVPAAVTFGANAGGMRAATPDGVPLATGEYVNPNHTLADRMRGESASRIARAAQEAAYVRRFGQGQKVHLRPRRY